MTHPPSFSTEPRMLYAELVTQDLMRFDAEAGSWQAPFAMLLLHAESIASFRLAGRPVQARHVALASLNRTLSRDAKLVVANARGIEMLLGRADGLTVEAMVELQRVLSSALPYLPNEEIEIGCRN